MKTDAFYGMRVVKVIVSVSLIVYISTCVLAILELWSASNFSTNDFISNYDKSYRDSVMIRDKTKYEDTSNDYTLSNIKYDISSLYLDWSEIEKERKRIEEESKLLKQQLLYSNSTVTKSNSVVIPNGSLPIPNISDTSFKGYMCMHKVTSQSSKQWKFLHSGEFELHTDNNGILMYNDYYVVAMASYYTNYKVGSTFRITLDSGVVFDVITGDEKSDLHTDELRMYRPKGDGRGEIIEFVIACGAYGENCNKYNTMSSTNRALGNLSSLGFQGNVIKIEKLDDYSVSNKLYS